MDFSILVVGYNHGSPYLMDLVKQCCLMFKSFALQQTPGVKPPGNLNPTTAGRRA